MPMRAFPGRSSTSLTTICCVPAVITMSSDFRLLRISTVVTLRKRIHTANRLRQTCGCPTGLRQPGSRAVLRTVCGCPQNPCHARPRRALPCLAEPCLAWPCHAAPCRDSPRQALCYFKIPALPCLALPRRAIHTLVASRRALPCLSQDRHLKPAKLRAKVKQPHHPTSIPCSLHQLFAVDLLIVEVCRKFNRPVPENRSCPHDS